MTDFQNLNTRKYGRKVATWTFNIQSMDVRAAVYMHGATMTAINTEHELIVMGTDTVKLRDEMCSAIKEKLVTVWEPWILYKLRFAIDEDNNTNEGRDCSIAIEYSLLDRTNVGTGKERFRWVTEYYENENGFLDRSRKGTFVREARHKSSDPERGSPLSEKRRSYNDYGATRGLVRDTPEIRLAFDEVMEKFRELHTKLKGKLGTPENAVRFLQAIAANKLPALPAGKPKPAKGARS